MKIIKFAIPPLALLISVIASTTPVFAGGPEDLEWARYVGYPFGMVEGMLGGFLHAVISALALAALGAIAVTFVPNELRRVSETAQNSPMPSLGVGCLTLFVALPLFVLLIVLIVTIPVAVLLPLVVGVAWVMGWISIGWLAGEKLADAVNGQGSWKAPVVTAIVGILVLALVSAVPLIGWLVALVVGSIGLGAVILSRFGTRRYPATATLAAATPTAPTSISE